jgi:hypothetical protein
LIVLKKKPSHLGLVLPIKNPEKSSEFWQNFQTYENSTDFSNCIPIKNSEEKYAEILQASSTKNLSVKLSDLH